MDVAGKAGGLIKVPRDSSTLNDRELNRGETSCLGDIWDLTGGDTADVVEAKRFLKSPGDSSTVDDCGVGRGEACCLGYLAGGDAMDVAGKAGGLINVLGDSSTLNDRELG